MATQQDCTEIEQANVQRLQQLEEIEDVLQDQQNFINGLEPSDPQRSDIQNKIESLTQQRAQLLVELQQGDAALKDCQQANQTDSNV